MIAFYYGLTGFACVWFYRKSLTESARSLWLRGILPLLGGLILWFAMFWFLWYNWVTPSNSYTTWTFPGTHRVIGGVFVIDVGAIVLGHRAVPDLPGRQSGLLPGRDPEP